MNRRRFFQTLGLGLVAAGWGASKLRAAINPADEVVRDSIRRQRILRLTYRGYMRLVEPHAIGITTGGHRALLAWQVEGGSKSDPPTGWRTFLIEEIKSPSVTVRGFTPRDTYSREKLALRIELDVHGEDTPR